MAYKGSRRISQVKTKNLGDNDLVWAKNDYFSYAEKNESSTFNRYTDKVGLGEKYKSNGYRKITLYSFRSYFFSRAADVHREGYAHRMTGHGGYLPQYDRMSEEKRLNWFLKLEPDLLNHMRNHINSMRETKNSRYLTRDEDIQECVKARYSRPLNNKEYELLEIYHNYNTKKIDRIFILSESSLSLVEE